MSEDHEKSDSFNTRQAITEQQREIASASHQDYENGKLESCLQHLHKLIQGRPHDFKAIMNKAVIEFSLSGFTKLDEFKKGLNLACQQAKISVSKPSTVDEIEHCVLYYNQVVILFHTRQYKAALLILEKLYNFIDPLEDSFVRRICFLLIELYIRTFQYNKALGMINRSEKIFEPYTKSSELEGGGTGEKPEKLETSNQDSKDASENEVAKRKLTTYKIRCHLATKSVRSCKRELKTVLPNVGSIVTYVYLKANLEYIRGNYRKCLKIIGSVSASGAVGQSAAVPFTETGDNMSVLYHNNLGCSYLYIGKPTLASFYFHKSIEENANAINSIAQKESDGSLSLSGRPLHTVGSNYRPELVYNMGISLLMCKKPQQAFECLVEAVQSFNTNPRLWLRLAECCIMAYRADNESGCNMKDRKKHIVQKAVGSGVNRKLIISSGLSPDYRVSAPESHSAAIPALTMEFAALCLKNAMALLPDDVHTPDQPSASPPTGQQSSSDDQDASTHSQDVQFVPAPPGNAIQGAEITAMRNSILAALAYVSLCLQDYVMAYHNAQTLLGQPRLSTVHKYLGQMYSAEALMMLNKMADSVKQISDSVHIRELSMTLPSTEDGNSDAQEQQGSNRDGSPLFEGWYPNTLSSARILMQYNLAVVHCVRGELDKTSEILQQIAQFSKSQGNKDIPVQALMLSIYINLRLGCLEQARNMLKTYCPQYF